MKLRCSFVILTAFLCSCIDEPISGTETSSLGFYSSSKKILNELNEKKKNNAEHFMMGLACKDEKKLKKSIYHFANSSFDSYRKTGLKLFPQPVYSFMNSFHFKSPFYNDAAYQIADLFFEYKEYKYVVKFIDLISSSGTGLYRDAIILKSKAYSKLKEYDNAIESLNELHNLDKRSSKLVTIRKASIYELKGDYQDAVLSYISIIKAAPNSWQSTIAVTRIMSILLKFPVQMNDNDYLKIIQALYYSGKYKQSLKMLYRKQNAGTPAERTEYQLRSLIRTKKIKTVKKILIEKKTDPVQYNHCLKITADELWTMKSQYRAVPYYKKISASEFEPDSKESLKKLIIFYEDRKNPVFRIYLSKYLKKYPSSPTVGYFLWIQARNLIRDRHFQKANEYLKKYLSNFPKGKYSDRCRFWIYKIHAGTKKSKIAEKAAEELLYINPDSSYTWALIKEITPMYNLKNLKRDFKKALATGDKTKQSFFHSILLFREKNFQKREIRIQRLNRTEKKSFLQLEKDIKNAALDNKKTVRLLEKYFAIGNTRAIKREMNMIRDSAKNINIVTAYLAGKYNNHYLYINSIYRLLKIYNLREDISIMPLSIIKKLSPLAFNNCIAKTAKKNKIEKNMIYAVIKAESEFNNNAVSPAGAAGLMQLMPGTAKDMAKKYKINKPDIKDPCTSIILGTGYLSWLKSYFKGKFELMVAGYNAGAGNVNKWLKKIPSSDKDFFTECVPFNETRYYMLKTNKFLSQYRLIYPEIKQ